MPQSKGEKSLDSVVHIVGCTFFLPCGLSFYKTLINGDSVKNDSEKSVSIVAVHKDKDVCFNSSSGGAYTSICSILDDDETYFAGVTIDDEFKVFHEISDDYKMFRKSKYVMSDTNGIFSTSGRNTS